MNGKLCPSCKKNERTKHTKKYAAYCKDCTNTKNKNRYLNDKSRHLLRSKAHQARIKFELHCLKASIGCYMCSETDPRALDFHHKNPQDKKGQILILWHNLGKQVAMEEIAKCELLCANCHRKCHCPLYLTEDPNNDDMITI